MNYKAKKGIMPKKLPIGLSDFKELIEDNYYYIDKSLFIKEIIDSGSKVILIPRPRRFGKTLNLSMLRYFFEKSDADPTKLFKNLAIWKMSHIYREMAGQYPVIYITFKDIKMTSWESCYDGLVRILTEEFLRHAHHFVDHPIDEADRRDIKSIEAYTGNQVLYEQSIRILTRLLEQSTGKRVIILIDEYDVPIECGYNYNYYEQIVTFMRNLLSGAFKDNRYLQKGVLTGILRIGRESIFSGLNNLEVCTLLSPRFNTCFGLTQKEVDTIIRDFGSADDKECIAQWYNGYCFGNNMVYNPWSIINYVTNSNEGFKPYWLNTSDNRIIDDILRQSDASMKKDVEVLLNQKPITKTIDEHIIYSDIGNDTSTIWSFLLFSGYLKNSRTDLVEGEYVCTLEIPNKEVYLFYKKAVMNWLSHNVSNEHSTQLLESLVRGDSELFKTLFVQYIQDTFSYFDPTGKEPEKVYHAFVLGILASLSDSHIIRSNRESGYGRYDIMVIPREKTNPGIIFEFKKINPTTHESLEEGARAALLQIEEKKYRTELQTNGITSIVEMGVAFKGKQVLVKDRKLKCEG